MTISAVAARQKSQIVCESGTGRSSHVPEHEPEGRAARQLRLPDWLETERAVVREVLRLGRVEVGRDTEFVSPLEALRQERAADARALCGRRDREHPDEEVRV